MKFISNIKKYKRELILILRNTKLFKRREWDKLKILQKMNNKDKKK